jgi:alpha-L-rhamnosidase
MARDTFDRLMAHPTWPTEWAAHMIFMAHADWMQTGDTRWLAPRYAALKTKLHLESARSRRTHRQHRQTNQARRPH